ncbi:MAG: carboxypeptidase-like regulatory domain-containing protein [Planctomycetaceae bacterium]|jgi:hypothetical protein|nr:carboxypeptidase-like regulatory domain-containing protein [Planctomycetaceae bacterium]
MTKHSIAVLSLLCATMSFSGCGRSQSFPPGMPKSYPAAITIIQDGQGLDGASVTLMPLDGSTWYASANTDAHGAAVLMTQGQYPGVVPGRYKILVTKRDTAPSTVVIPDPDIDPAGYSKALEQANKEVLESFDLIDPKYASVDAAPEEIEIIAGKNEKTIDVGKAVRIKTGRR